MNRNVESHFALNPTNIDIRRSTFDRSHSLKTSFNVGDIVPFFLDEVLPGDTFNVDTSKVVRLQTLLTPVMDNIYLDTYFFFVPNRLTWSHWKQFNGENTESAWIPQTEYEIPQITAPADSGWSVGTIADYLGVPTGIPNLSVSALPFRAYALVMNEWFRDENLSDPLVVPVDDATVAGVNTGTFVIDVAKGGLPYKAAKYHDYFTSCLPSPQKGPDVLIPVASAGNYAVVGNGKSLGLTDGSLTGLFGYQSVPGGSTLAVNSGTLGSSVGTAVPSSSNLNGSVGVATVSQLGDDLSKSGLIAVASGNAAAATVLLPDVLQGFGKIVVVLHGGTIRITDQLTDVWHLEANIAEHGIRENINIEVSLHRVHVVLVSGEDKCVVRFSIDTQRHAEHFIPALIPPRLCRRKIAAVDPHIRRQQTAGVGDKGTVPGIVVPLWVNKETVRSLRVEDEQAVPGVIIVPNGIFVLCDEIIVNQQCAAELPEPLAWQLNDLIHGTGVCLTPGLLTLQFCLNDHRESPPISMWLLWLPFITSSMLI